MHIDISLGGQDTITVNSDLISLKRTVYNHPSYGNGERFTEIHYYIQVGDLVYDSNRNDSFLAIKQVEYDRIKNILDKLNLAEVEMHNATAKKLDLPEKIITEQECNGMMGLEI